MAVYAHLRTGGRLSAVEAPVPGLTPEYGEYAVAVFANTPDSPMMYARYFALEASYADGGPTFVAGSPQFVTGYLVGSAVHRARLRRLVRRATAAQWRPSALIRTVLTTRRLWCQIADGDGTCWVRFNYDTIANLNLAENHLTLTFQAAHPLLLSGDAAPWCAAVVGHFRFGEFAARVLPALQDSIAPSTRTTVRLGRRRSRAGT